MSSLTSLLLLVACAALLQVGCEAQLQSDSRRNNGDSQIALGTIEGNDIVPLAVVHIGPGDIILGFPDNCAQVGKLLLGTQVIVSNNHGSTSPELTPDDTNDPRSNLKIHCPFLGVPGSGCIGGMTVTSYQFCQPQPLPASTTPED